MTKIDIVVNWSRPLYDVAALSSSAIVLKAARINVARRARATTIYAEEDKQKAIEAMMKVG